MKSLTLLRHAKSSWTDQGLADSERPLSKRGLRDAPEMGARLVQCGLKPDLILSSPATRARQTAEYIAASFESSGIEISFEPNIYLASPGELLKTLANVSDTIDSLILIGHNPGLTQLANIMLSDLALSNLPTAGAVAIDCDMESWRSIESARFSLRFYDFPKKAAAPK